MESHTGPIGHDEAVQRTDQLAQTAGKASKIKEKVFATSQKCKEAARAFFGFVKAKASKIPRIWVPNKPLDRSATEESSLMVGRENVIPRKIVLIQDFRGRLKKINKDIDSNSIADKPGIVKKLRSNFERAKKDIDDLDSGAFKGYVRNDVELEPLRKQYVDYTNELIATAAKLGVDITQPEVIRASVISVDDKVVAAEITTLEKSAPINVKKNPVQNLKDGLQWFKSLASRTKSPELLTRVQAQMKRWAAAMTIKWPKVWSQNKTGLLNAVQTEFELNIRQGLGNINNKLKTEMTPATIKNQLAWVDKRINALLGWSNKFKVQISPDLIQGLGNAKAQLMERAKATSGAVVTKPEVAPKPSPASLIGYVRHMITEMEQKNGRIPPTKENLQKALTVLRSIQDYVNAEADEGRAHNNLEKEVLTLLGQLDVMVKAKAAKSKPTVPPKPAVIPPPKFPVSKPAAPEVKKTKIGPATMPKPSKAKAPGPRPMEELPPLPPGARAPASAAAEVSEEIPDIEEMFRRELGDIPAPKEAQAPAKSAEVVAHEDVYVPDEWEEMLREVDKIQIPAAPQSAKKKEAVATATEEDVEKDLADLQESLAGLDEMAGKPEAAPAVAATPKEETKAAFDFQSILKEVDALKIPKKEKDQKKYETALVKILGSITDPAVFFSSVRDQLRSDHPKASSEEGRAQISKLLDLSILWVNSNPKAIKENDELFLEITESVTDIPNFAAKGQEDLEEKRSELSAAVLNIRFPEEDIAPKRAITVKPASQPTKPVKVAEPQREEAASKEDRIEEASHFAPPPPPPPPPMPAHLKPRGVKLDADAAAILGARREGIEEDEETGDAILEQHALEKERQAAEAELRSNKRAAEARAEDPEQYDAHLEAIHKGVPLRKVVKVDKKNKPEAGGGVQSSLAGQIDAIVKRRPKSTKRESRPESTTWDV